MTVCVCVEENALSMQVCRFGMSDNCQALRPFRLYMFGKKHLRANTNTPMIAVLMLVESKDPGQDSVGKAHRESEDIRDGLKAALQTLTELIREGLFLRGHFKLASLQQVGDTGSAPRELWVRVNGKWSVEMNQSHMTLLDDFLLLSPPTITFTTAFFCFF